MNHAPFLRTLSMRLLYWSVPSVGIGTNLLILKAPVIRGVAVQMVAWGAIDALIAVAGLLSSARGARRPVNETDEVRRTLRLRRVLVVNGWLDVVYIATGVAIAVFLRSNPFLLGTGIGIAIQGAFLLLFDRAHAVALPQHPPAWYDPDL